MTPASATKTGYGLLSLPVLVGALGYLVDAYDLVIFNAVRQASLRDIGVAEEQLLQTGLVIINAQMLGLIIGGLLFGVLGDRFGRARVLFASIFTYSAATLACAFVTNVPMYVVLRFVAGLGIAAELGLAITLASELLAKERGGYGAALIAGLGMIGAVLAGLAATYLHWQTCYVIGGMAGFVLLLLRAKIAESTLFKTLEQSSPKGSLKHLFSSADRIKRFTLCILTGVPIPFVFWLLTAFAPEFTAQLGLSEPLTAAQAMIYVYIGLTIGDLTAASLSQKLRSRRLILLVFQLVSMVFCAWFLLAPHADSVIWFKTMYLLLGFFSGYWAIMALVAAEKFGTNLRATVATSVPNIARAAIIPMGMMLTPLKASYGLIHSALIVGAVFFTIAIVATFLMKETHGLDMDYVEK